MQQVDRLGQANQVGLPFEGEVGDGCHGDSFIMTASERCDELIISRQTLFQSHSHPVRQCVAKL